MLESEYGFVGLCPSNLSLEPPRPTVHVIDVLALDTVSAGECLNL